MSLIIEHLNIKLTNKGAERYHACPLFIGQRRSWFTRRTPLRRPTARHCLSCVLFGFSSVSVNSSTCVCLVFVRSGQTKRWRSKLKSKKQGKTYGRIQHRRVQRAVITRLATPSAMTAGSRRPPQTTLKQFTEQVPFPVSAILKVATPI